MSCVGLPIYACTQRKSTDLFETFIVLVSRINPHGFACKIASQELISHDMTPVLLF